MLQVEDLNYVNKMISTYRNHPFNICNPRTLTLLLCLILSGSAGLAQSNQRFNKNGDKINEQRTWIEADFIRLPKSEHPIRIFIPFSLTGNQIPFKRIADKNEYQAEFELGLTLYAVTEISKRSDRDLRDQNKLTDQMKSYRFLISEEERIKGYRYQDFFEINLPELPEMREFIAVFELIELDGESVKERIPVTSKLRTESWIVPIREDAKPDSSILFNRGNQVPYGEDFDIMIHLSPSQLLSFGITDSTDSLHIHIKSKRTDVSVFEGYQTVSYSSDIKPFSGNGSFVGLIVDPATEQSNTSWGYLYLDIPGLKLPNEPVEITIFSSAKTSDKKEHLTFTLTSIWPDMPSSLLRLDIALDQLSLLLPENKVTEMKKGSREDRIKSFYTYWDPLDPSPETHINELMVEFYVRIDRANQRFTTPSKTGSESDQGQQFILFGEPDKIERIFPINGPSLELWYYPAFLLTFEATTGFGDYKLIDRKSL